MAENTAVQFEEDDYFREPDYERLTDEELYELYHFGEPLSTAQNKSRFLKKAVNVDVRSLDFSDEDWLEMNLEADDSDEYLFED